MDVDNLIERGLWLIDRQNYIEAEIVFRAVIVQEPQQIAGYLNLGFVLWHLNDVIKAAESLEAALTLRPDLPQVHINLGAMYLIGEQYANALEHLNTGISQQPTAYAHRCRGVIYQRQGRRQLALSAFEDAINLEPHDWLAHVERAGELLVLCRFAEGWREYEARLSSPTVRESSAIKLLNQDCRWDGSFVEHLLIACEQGVGDTIQACRYIDLATERCGRLSFLSPPSLATLLQSSFAHNHKVTITTKQSACDAYQWLESLPGMFGAGDDPIPQTPYLFVPRSQPWQKAVSEIPGLKVGLVWAGQPALMQDKRRSIDIAILSGLFEIPGFSFISLQLGRDETHARLYDATPQLSDWFTTATIVQELDLVISVDTAVAHLAGALGKPIWLLNRFDTCWRWELDRSDSRWYPTMRIFRQPSAGDWRSVVEAVSSALMALVS